MPNPAETHIDDAVSQAELLQYSREMGISMRQAIHTQAKALVIDLAKVTAPFGTLSGRESWSAQRKIGLAAVARDIGRVFVPVEEMKILSQPTSEKLRARVAKLMRAKDVPALRSIFSNIGIETSAFQWFPSDLGEHHRRQRNRRGGVGRRPVQAFVREPERRKFLRKKQANVFRAKGGWSIPALMLGAKLPAMVTKHAAPGSLLDQTDRENNPWLVMTNSVPYIQQALSRTSIQFALRNRESAMRRQLNYAAGVNARRASGRMRG